MFRLLLLKDDTEVYENKYVSRGKQPVYGYRFTYFNLKLEVYVRIGNNSSYLTRLRVLLPYRNTFVVNMPIKYVCKHSRSLNV